MATRAELIADVYTLTKRPDLVDRTDMAVRAATLKAHHSDFYPKDIKEVGIQWTTPDYTQQLDYRGLIPRWRAFKYMRKVDAAQVPGEFFELITPEQALDSYKVTRENVCYLAGEVIQIRSNTLDDFMLLGHYTHPDTTEASYDSWIAKDHPFVIVHEAAAIIFDSIGFNEQAQTQRRDAGVYYSLLVQEVVANGY